MIPIFDDDDEIEYYWYVGDPVPTVGLWKRAAEYEFPIYQNTRGQAVFNAADVTESWTEKQEPTEAFWRALSEIVNDEGDEVDLEGCEWYEREFINSAFGIFAQDDGQPTELAQLFAQVDERGDGA